MSRPEAAAGLPVASCQLPFAGCILKLFHMSFRLTAWLGLAWLEAFESKLEPVGEEKVAVEKYSDFILFYI